MVVAYYVLATLLLHAVFHLTFVQAPFVVLIIRISSDLWKLLEKKLSE
jgi:hypothetical protein